MNTGRKNLERRIAEDGRPLPTSGRGSVVIYTYSYLHVKKDQKMKADTEERMPSPPPCATLCLR